MQSPCPMRSTGNVGKSGATASSAVGIDSKARLTRMPNRRSMCWLNTETTNPATAMPIMLALTAKPIAAGVTRYARVRDGRMACVANRSTTVRNAVNPITTVCSRTLDAPACISAGGESRAGIACIMILSLVAEGCDAPSGASRCLNDAHASSHVVVALVVKDIAHKQNDGLVAEVLPPVRGAARLRPDIAGFVHDRISAVAGVFDDLALGDVDDRGAVAVAVPWHDAARLDRELAETQLAILDVRRLLLEVDGGEHRVGERLSVAVWHFLGVQQRAPAWPFQIGGISVPSEAPIDQADVLPVLILDVRDEQDFRIVVQQIFLEHMDFQLAEAAAPLAALALDRKKLAAFSAQVQSRGSQGSESRPGSSRNCASPGSIPAFPGCGRRHYYR